MSEEIPENVSEDMAKTGYNKFAAIRLNQGADIIPTWKTLEETDPTLKQAWVQLFASIANVRAATIQTIVAARTATEDADGLSRKIEYATLLAFLRMRKMVSPADMEILAKEMNEPLGIVTNIFDLARAAVMACGPVDVANLNEEE